MNSVIMRCHTASDTMILYIISMSVNNNRLHCQIQTKCIMQKDSSYCMCYELSVIINKK